MQLFARVKTQWRTGPGGAVGIDLCAVYPLIDRLGLSAVDWDCMLADVQVMEDAALAYIHEQMAQA